MRYQLLNAKQIAEIEKSGSGRYFRASANDNELLLEIYGPIGASMWENGVTSQQVADALKGPEASVNVRVNSPGGSVFEGLTIYNLLKTSGKKIKVTVDGMAASAASVIAMAGSVIEMNEGTMIMIHPANTIEAGTAKDLRKTADLLDKVSNQMAEIYANRTGTDLSNVLAMMDEETWMSRDEAIHYGFADKAVELPGEADKVAAQFDLASVYAKTPENLRTFKAETADELEPITKIEEQTGPIPGTPIAALLKRRLELL